MKKAHLQFPVYGWAQNKGYPTIAHKTAILNHGTCPLHRKTFNYHLQLKLKF
jgi:ribonuclease HII